MRPGIGSSTLAGRVPADRRRTRPTDKQPQACAVTLDGRVVGGYLMIHVPMANEIVLLAIDPAYRRRGLGRMCCMDALFRSGKRPLVLTANDDSVGFAKRSASSSSASASRPMDRC